YQQLTAERQAQLNARGITSKDQADQARAQADATSAIVKADRAAVESAKAQLSAQGAAVDSARVSLGYTLIRSPIEGRTGSLGVKVGGLVTANQTELMTIASGSDRKSTRLNSSHVAISYAVFCLKKKSCPVQHVT